MAKAPRPGILASGNFERDYDLQARVLGWGASGDVREAICRRTGKTVAVKSFTKEGMSVKQWENLKSECEIHGSVEHPSIVRLEGLYESDAAMHIVTERLCGGDVFDRVVNAGGLQEEEAARVTAQILRALAYLHARHVVHRDIKPENIVYQENGKVNVKVIDFGFAARLEQGHRFQRDCGTLEYIAPEVLAKRGYDEKADMWSLGCTVYVMLLARSLYTGTRAEVMNKNRDGLLDYHWSFGALSPGAQDFVRSLLVLEPSQRPSALDALRHPWLREHGLEDIAVVAQGWNGGFTRAVAAASEAEEALGIKRQDDGCADEFTADPKTEHTKASLLRPPAAPRLGLVRAALVLFNLHRCVHFTPASRDKVCAQAAR